MPVRTKLAVPIAVAILLAGLATAVLVQRSVQVSLEDEQHQRALALSSELSARSTTKALVEDVVGLDHVVAELSQRQDVMYVVVIGASGFVLADSFAAGIPAGLIDVFESGRQDVADPVPFRTEAGVVHDYVAPMLGGRLGTVHLGMGQTRIRDRAREEGRLVLMLAVGAALFNALLAALLAHLATRPARQLTMAASRVAAGDLEVRSGVRTEDELGDLAEQFDEMVRRLRESHNKLNEAHHMVVRAERLAVVGQVASGIAHEIGNPLHAARQFIEALVDNPAAHRRYLPLAQEALDRIDNVISEMLGFTRERSLRPRAVDVNDAVSRALDFLRYDQRSRNVTLLKDLVDDLPDALVDPGALNQVLINLVVNSLDALDGQGTITIQTAPAVNGDGGRRVLVRIRDDGPGIDTGSVERVFDPFFTTKEPGMGTGLGLSVSQQMMVVQGARLDYVEPEGPGACFEIMLPVEANS